MTKLITLSILFLTGLFFLLGAIIISKVKNKKAVYQFATALAFSVIIGVLLFDLFPEIIENFHSFTIKKIIINTLAYTLLGIIGLKLLDEFIPAHKHIDNRKNLQERKNHFFHISIITTIAILIHNIIEGMAIYTICLNSLKSGILMAIGILLHNIPMGIEIYLTLDLSKKSNLNKIIIYTCLILSPLLGGLSMLIFNSINSVILGILLCITAGMLIYISFFELFAEIKNNIKNKQTIRGLICGLILIIITILI